MADNSTVTESEPGEPEEPASGQVARHPHTRPKISSEVLMGAVVLIGGGFVAALGLAEVPRGWIVAGTLVLTLAGVFVGHATREDVDDHRRVRSLGFSVVALVVFIVGVAAYNLRFDPSRNSGSRLWEFVLADAGETQCIRVSGEPAGPALVLDPGSNRELAPICGGSTYYVECREDLGADSIWLRLAGGRFWVAEAMMRPRNGATDQGLPNC